MSKGDPGLLLRLPSLFKLPFSVTRAVLRQWQFIAIPLLVLSIRAQSPRLELSRAPQGPNIQLQLSGETNRAYVIEISTNLSSWQTLVQLQTTNGVATLSYDTSQAHHSFLRARAEHPPISLTPKVAPNFGVSAFFSADGGELGLVTPDLRSIRLSIPPGCLVEPTEVQLSLVTNLVGLPFAQGTIGTVQIEPEGLLLMGAATLSIEFPQGLDLRRVISFVADNDGTGFSLAPDRVYTNRVVIPLSDFAMYGTAIATLEEIEALGPSSRQLSAQMVVPPLAFPPLTPFGMEVCRRSRPDLFTTDTSQFPDSTHQCFEPLVTRAIQVQHELRAYMECSVKPAIATLMGQERQMQMFDTGMTEEEMTAFYAGLIPQICPIYQEMIEPYWAEAEENCALSIVLMQFMLGFERQVQLLNATNLVNCNYTLVSNQDKVCRAAEECIKEIKLCCFQGHRGQEKYLEIQSILRQIEAIGDTNCFPLQMDDPRVLEALDVCLTNAWYGSLLVSHFGATNRLSTAGNTEMFQTGEINLSFNGTVFSSDEQPGAPELGKAIGLRVLGDGTAKIEDTFTSIIRTRCRDGSTIVSFRSFDHEINTGAFSGTNGPNVVLGEYDMGIRIHDDNLSYTIGSAGPLIFTKIRRQHFSSSAVCEGQPPAPNNPDPTISDAGAGFPMLPPITRPMGADTNILQGTYRVVDTSGDFPVTSTIIWNFRRVQQR